MDKNLLKTIIAAAIVSAGVVGASKAVDNAANEIVSKAAAPTVDQPAGDGCTVERVHTSNYSRNHPVDDAPTYEVKKCQGIEVDRMEVATEKDEKPVDVKEAGGAEENLGG